MDITFGKHSANGYTSKIRQCDANYLSKKKGLFHFTALSFYTAGKNTKINAVSESAQQHVTH